VTRNKHENIYVLASDGTRIARNTITTNDSAAIFLKHSNGSYVAKNTVLYGAIHIRGDSADNTFVGNALRGNGYFFQAYLETTGEWTFPHNNAVIDGKVENTKTCLRFEGAYDNTVDGLMLDDECQVTMTPMGGQDASGNVVHTLPLP
jgi:parallel beta-helix repeat protein